MKQLVSDETIEALRELERKREAEGAAANELADLRAYVQDLLARIVELERELRRHREFRP